MPKWTKIRDLMLPASRSQASAIRNQFSEIRDHVATTRLQTMETCNMVEAIIKKMCMTDDIWQNNDVRFYVPNYPLDLIQRVIVDSELFFEQNILDALSGFMPQNAVVCDIGANIGNHTLYWLSRRQASYVYCFEPRPETFLILEKNLQINNFENVCRCFNLGLSDKRSKLKIDTFTNANIGGTSFVDDEHGQFEAVPLDSLHFDKSVDFMKIDVEGMEDKVLQGAAKLIEKDKPIIFIESFADNFPKVQALLEGMGYVLQQPYEFDNYLFTPGQGGQAGRLY